MLDFDFNEGPFSGAATSRDEFPAMYDYESARSVFWDLPEHELLLGINGEGVPETADLHGDSPHILISAASGAGKSATARNIATQALIKGYTVIFLDAKRHSHRWAKNLPQVHYAAGIREIGNALVSVAIEMHRRNEVVEEWPGDLETAPVGPRILLVFEEMNATIDMLGDLDKTLAKGEFTTRQAFADIMFLGRAAKVHVVAVAQYADRTVLRTALRENFGIRILIQHSWEAWNMLVPRASQAGGAPAAPTQAGRGYVVTKGKPQKIQLLFVNEELAAQLARDAYEARERAGLVPKYTRRELKRNARNGQRALASSRGTK